MATMQDNLRNFIRDLEPIQKRAELVKDFTNAAICSGQIVTAENLIHVLDRLDELEKKEKEREMSQVSE